MAGRGPLNYTTEIDPMKTAGECMGLLAARRATRVSVDYADGEPIALSFGLDTPNGMRFYVLSADPDGTLAVLERSYQAGKIEHRYVNRRQATRVAWRVVKEWLEVNFALIDMGLREFEQIMLPYLVVDEVGTTLYQRYLEQGQKAITG